MSDFKQLYDEKLKLQQRIIEHKRMLAEDQSRLVTVEKELKTESEDFTSSQRRRQSLVGTHTPLLIADLVADNEKVTPRNQ